MLFSLIIPVYNRPDEVSELLESLSQQDCLEEFEVVIIEDGSSLSCESVINAYHERLNISYHFKPNSGPGDSRNFGMKNAKGDYFIIFDSDCIIPPHYLSEVAMQLQQDYADCFGGPDKALDSFSDIQKAINFTMTSFLTTGGIRGGSEKIDKFQPRSFNMGLSRKAFEVSGGFGNIHPGEDPDLSIRLWECGFTTKLYISAYVYHKRRIDWQKFSMQVNKFGKARPILNSWHPKYSKVTYIFPSLFIVGLCAAIVLIFFKQFLLIKFYLGYSVILFLISTIQNRSLKIGYLSLIAVWKQFSGYGIGFMESYYRITILGQKPQEAFPELFFSTWRKSLA